MNVKWFLFGDDEGCQGVGTYPIVDEGVGLEVTRPNKGVSVVVRKCRGQNQVVEEWFFLELEREYRERPGTYVGGVSSCRMDNG